MTNTTQPDQPVDELEQIEKDLADSFEQFRLVEGVYLSGTPASSMMAAHQFIVRLQAYFKNECQAECNRARLDERKKSQAFLHGLTITPENRHLFDVLSRDNYECIQQLLKGEQPHE